MGEVVKVLKTQGEPELRTLVQWNGVPVDGPAEPTEDRPAVLVAPFAGSPSLPLCAFDAVPAWGSVLRDPRTRWRPAARGSVAGASLVGPLHVGRWIFGDGFPIDSPVRYFDTWATPAEATT